MNGVHTHIDRSWANRIEDAIRRIGQAASWLCLVLVGIVCASVFMRYALGQSSLAFDELQWHIYALSWLLGFSYATVERSHVRNDILYSRFSAITQKRIDYYGHLLLVLPFVAIVLYHAWVFVEWAYIQNEGSIDEGGLPHRWVIKSALLLGFFLFGLATVTRVVDLGREIRGLKEARR